jgi:hypothetical protein
MTGTNSWDVDLPRFAREADPACCTVILVLSDNRQSPILSRFRELAGLTVVLLISPDEYCENVTSTLVRVLPLIVTLEPRTSFFKGLRTDERRDQFQQAR